MTDGSNRNPNSPSPFLVKTYEMVNEPSTDSVVSWSAAGISFVVWNPPEFSRDMLPKYFKHNNFSSFIRQLNTYGFRKVDPHQWEFANEEFARGHKHLLKNIHRRKPGHSHANAAPLSDEERREFVHANESLRQENISLQSEIDRHKNENREYENQVRSLVQTLRRIEQRQKRLKIGLGRLLEKPGGVNKKRRVLGMQRLRQEDEEENLGVSNEDVVERLDSSTAFWDGFVDEIPGSNEDDWCCSPGVDVSTLSMEQQERDGGVVSSVGANDDFWQQFFTEDPGRDRAGH